MLDTGGPPSFGWRDRPESEPATLFRHMTLPAFPGFARASYVFGSAEARAAARMGSECAPCVDAALEDPDSCDELRRRLHAEQPGSYAATSRDADAIEQGAGMVRAVPGLGGQANS